MNQYAFRIMYSMYDCDDNGSWLHWPETCILSDTGWFYCSLLVSLADNLVDSGRRLQASVQSTTKLIDVEALENLVLIAEVSSEWMCFPTVYKKIICLADDRGLIPVSSYVFLCVITDFYLQWFGFWPMSVVIVKWKKYYGITKSEDCLDGN